MKERWGNWNRKNREGPASSALDSGIVTGSWQDQSPFAYLSFYFFIYAVVLRSATHPDLDHRDRLYWHFSTAGSLRSQGNTLGTASSTPFLPIAIHILIPGIWDTLRRSQNLHDSIIQGALLLKVTSLRTTCSCLLKVHISWPFPDLMGWPSLQYWNLHFKPVSRWLFWVLKCKNCYIRGEFWTHFSISETCRLI